MELHTHAYTSASWCGLAGPDWWEPCASWHVQLGHVCRSARVCRLQRCATTALWPPWLSLLLVSFCHRCFGSLVSDLCPLVDTELILLKNLYLFVFWGLWSAICMSLIKTSLLNGGNVRGLLDSNRERRHFLSQEMTTNDYICGVKRTSQTGGQQSHMPTVQGSWSNYSQNKSFH